VRFRARLRHCGREPGEAEPSIKPDPLIQALAAKLPKPDTIWSIDDRAKWLKTAAMAFNLVYRTSGASDGGPALA